MALALIGLVVIVGSVVLASTRSARRERRLPPHLSFLLEHEPGVQDGRFRRLLAWLRRLLSESDDRYRGWPSGGGGFGGFGGFGGCGGGGGGGGGGCGGSGGGGC
jgi:hypothetical protein